MTAETIVIFFISLILLWLKPGPGQALRLTYALEFGGLKAFFISLGVITICLGYFIFVALGYSAIPSESVWLFTTLKILGALYFIYLGAKGLLKNHSKKNQIEPPKLPQNIGSGFLKDYSLGLLMALSNPITIFYFIGILPTLLPLDQLAIQDIIIGMILVLSAGAIVDGLLIILTVLAKEVFARGNTLKVLGLLTNISFVLIGLFLLYSAIFLPDGIKFNVI